MFRWIWLVPPQIVSEREKKNADTIGLTGYPGRRRSRWAPGQDSLGGPVVTSIPDGPWRSSASSIAAWCISDQNIMLVAPRAATLGSLVLEPATAIILSPFIRRIWIFV